MSTEVQTAVGRFVWHEQNSNDPKQAQDFYSRLFDWEIEVWKPGEFDYGMIKANEQTHGGFGEAQGGAPPHWHGHVWVESVDEAAEKVKAGGGNILAGPIDMPEVGRFLVFSDPQGAVVSAYQPEGEGPVGEGVFVWDELVTSDLEAAKRFYGDVFGWTSRSMDMGEGGSYTLFQRAGGVDTAGAMTLPDPAPPPHWLPYVGVDDPDATTTKAKELGGSAIREPFDIPTVGRIAILKDPQGAVFGLFKGEQ